MGGRLRAAASVFLFLGLGLSPAMPTESASAQNPGIQVVGATPTSPLALTHGCNAIIIQSPNGTRVAAIAALVSPSAAVVSIWRYSNAGGQYQVGWFADPIAPVTFSITGRGATGTTTETYSICVNQAATILPD
jgi:hypothetical protein